MRKHEIEPHTEGLEVDSPKTTLRVLSPEELQQVASGNLVGHVWVYLDDGTVFFEEAIEPDDTARFNDTSRAILRDHYDCHYGGIITPDEARVRFRESLHEVWRQTIDNSGELL